MRVSTGAIHRARTTRSVLPTLVILPAVAIAACGAESERPAPLPAAVAFDTPLAPAGFTAWAAEQGVTLELVETQHDPDGHPHHRYRQLHQGAPVEGTGYIGHVRDGLITSASGLAYTAIAIDPAATLEPTDAESRVVARWPDVALIDAPELRIEPPTTEGDPFRLVYL